MESWNNLGGKGGHTNVQISAELNRTEDLAVGKQRSYNCANHTETSIKIVHNLNTLMFWLTLLWVRSSDADPDGDHNDSEVSDGGGIDCDSEEKIPIEIRRLVNMVRYLIPAVGQSVQAIKLGCCPGLTNGLVSN